MDSISNLKFLMFENEKNNCWLDSSVALIAHNKTFKKIVSCDEESQINKIITIHDETVSILNDSEDSIEQRRKKTREMLLEIQMSTLQQLKHMKFKPGEPDSAFCALLNLIYRDKSKIKEKISVSWIWRKMCTNCGSSSKSGTCIKPIITLTKVNKFQPECPASIYMCPCKTEQEMKLIYKELPPCLIFHFENGAGEGRKPPLSFTVKDREYKLTGIILLEKSSEPNLNHFVTWIRNPTYDLWLDCNDLNTNIISFSPIPPDMNLKDMYVCVFESFDNLQKISLEMTSDEEQDIENFNVEVIDLAGEAEDSKSASENTSCKSTASKFFKNKKSEEISSSNLIQNPKKQSKMDVSKTTVFSDKESKTDSISVQDVEKSDEKSSASTSSPFPVTSEKNADFKNSSNVISGVFEYQEKSQNNYLCENDCDSKKNNKGKSLSKKGLKTEITPHSVSKVTDYLEENKKENSDFVNVSPEQEGISSPVKSDNNNAEIVSNSVVQPLQHSLTESSEISDKSSAISELSDSKNKLDVGDDFPLTEKKDLNASLEGSTIVKKSKSSAESKSECSLTPCRRTKRTIKAPQKYKCFVATGNSFKKEKKVNKKQKASVHQKSSKNAQKSPMGVGISKDSNNGDENEKDKNENTSDMSVDIELKNIIDNAVENAFAAFVERVCEIGSQLNC